MAEPAKNFFYLVMVTCQTEAQAERVITERIHLDPSPDYGFGYLLRVVEAGEMEVQPVLDWGQNT